MKKIVSLILIAIVILSILVLPALAEAVPVEHADPAVKLTVDITDIITYAIGLILSVMFGFIIRVLVPPAKKWLDAHATKKQKDMMYQLIQKLVEAAEQTLGAGCGKAKLDYVCEELKQRGYTVDIQAIEAAVFEMNRDYIDTIFEESDGVTDDSMIDDLK